MTQLSGPVRGPATLRKVASLTAVGLWMVAAPCVGTKDGASSYKAVEVINASLEVRGMDTRPTPLLLLLLYPLLLLYLPLL